MEQNESVEAVEQTTETPAVEQSPEATPTEAPKMTLDYVRNKSQPTAEERYLLSEINKRNTENQTLRKEKNAAQGALDRARQLFPQIDEMTPEQMMAQMEEKDAIIAQKDQSIRTMTVDSILRTACSKTGADPEVMSALLEKRGVFDSLSLDDVEGATQVVSDAVGVILDEKQFLVAQKPGASVASGTGVTPGVSGPDLTESRWEDLIAAGKYAEADKVLSG